MKIVIIAFVCMLQFTVFSINDETSGLLHVFCGMGPATDLKHPYIILALHVLQGLAFRYLGLYSLRKHRLIAIGIPIIKQRRSSDRRRFMIGILIPIMFCRESLGIFTQNWIIFSNAVPCKCNIVFLYWPCSVQWLLIQHCRYWWSGSLAPTRE